MKLLTEETYELITTLFNTINEQRTSVALDVVNAMLKTGSTNNYQPDLRHIAELDLLEKHLDNFLRE